MKLFMFVFATLVLTSIGVIALTGTHYASQAISKEDDLPQSETHLKMRSAQCTALTIKRRGLQPTYITIDLECYNKMYGSIVHEDGSQERIVEDPHDLWRRAPL